ncbi:MAG: phosphosugar isomerase [Clostridiales bacterium]|jgi:tagatose-6-phosphate ketose/aldose isomerase|nr:phosphosugar isomerase [Clostridiales bacterium]
MRILGIKEKELKEIEGYYTCKEMINQPYLWHEGVKIIGENRERIKNFIDEIKAIKGLKIYLVGAGSSAKAAALVESYIGQVTGIDVYSVSSTNLITQPNKYISQDSPGLLVSFGSSGNTTEGLEAVELFKERCSKLFQILIICSDKGELVGKYSNQEDVLYVPIPEGTKGRSMAATGEFTLLVQYGLMLFDIDRFDYYVKMFKNVEVDAEYFFDRYIYKVHSIANKKYDVIAALGSNALTALASEMCLKISELSSGLQSTQFHPILEFRHGPKLIMNSKSLVSFFISNDPHTQKYEIDMLKECSENKRNSTIVAVSMDYSEEIDENCDYYFYFNRNGFNYRDDSHIIFQYALYLQSLAILKSVDLGISPDKLGSDVNGFVNKVAKGVAIYKR